MQLKTNICFGKPLLEKNGTSISDQCAVILIILMVLAAYPPRYPAQKVPEILLKSFTYKWPLLCILKRESIYWQDIATSIFELFYFKFYFELLLDLRHGSLLCWESFESSDNAFCLLKLEYPDVPHPSWNTRSYILDFDDFGSNQTWSDCKTCQKKSI